MSHFNKTAADPENLSQFSFLNKSKTFINFARQQLGKFGLVFTFFLLAAVISVLSPYFLTVDNLINVLMQASINLIIALGMTFVIATGGIDLSVGSIVGLAGMIMAKLLISEVSLPLTLGITLLCGVLMGAVNGILITRIGLPPFIATLGTMSIYRGVSLISNQGRPAYGLSSQMLKAIAGRIGPIPIPVVIAFISAIIAFFVLMYTIIGEYTLAIGGNEEAVRLSGVPVARYKTIVYSISGLMSSLAGIVLTARLTAAEPIAGTGYELDAIAAAVIGGTSLSGGVATIFGTVIGALIMSVLRNGLNLLNIQSYYQLVAIGSVIVIAVTIDTLRRKK
ncbi:MAG: ribose ABC transporter permease [Pelolinea sp.]|nr:ribose ABC transporter permease [Pelolinea sp.]